MPWEGEEGLARRLTALAIGRASRCFVGLLAGFHRDNYLRVAAGVSDAARATPRINVILNSFEELKERVPTGRR